MRLEQLFYMIEINKTHSFSIAAENLYIGQSTLSEAIKKLEDELEVTLFIRAKNGVYLTEVGQEILDIAVQMTRLSEQVKTVATKANQTIASEMTGELDISVSIGVAHEYLARMLPMFQKQYPFVALNVIERGFYTLLQRIQKKQCDLGITVTNHSDYWLANATDLHYKCLSVEDFYALVHGESPLAQRNTLSIRELVKHPIATLGYDDMDKVAGAHPLNDMLAQTAQFQLVFTTNNAQLFLDYLLRNKRAVGFPVSRFMLNDYAKLPQLTAVKITDDFKSKVYYLYRADNPRRPLIEAFLDMLQKSLF